LDCVRAESVADTCQFRRHQHLLHEGQQPDAIYRVEEGCACRYQMLGGARRQITALYLPGDYCEPQWLFGTSSAKAVVTLTPVRARRLPLDKLADLGPESRTALCSSILSMLDRQHDWIATLGRKSAVERVCALLSDIFCRMQNGAPPRSDRCLLPLTQHDMADIVGLTPVHVNRVLKELRSEGLLELHSRWLRLPVPGIIFDIGAGRSGYQDGKRTAV
jgi:CRP-like cAMP-binding protein